MEWLDRKIDEIEVVLVQGEGNHWDSVHCPNKRWPHHLLSSLVLHVLLIHYLELYQNFYTFPPCGKNLWSSFIPFLGLWSASIRVHLVFSPFTCTYTYLPRTLGVSIMSITCPSIHFVFICPTEIEHLTFSFIREKNSYWLRYIYFILFISGRIVSHVLQVIPSSFEHTTLGKHVALQFR